MHRRSSETFRSAGVLRAAVGRGESPSNPAPRGLRRGSSELRRPWRAELNPQLASGGAPAPPRPPLSLGNASWTRVPPLPRRYEGAHSPLARLPSRSAVRERGPGSGEDRGRLSSLSCCAGEGTAAGAQRGGGEEPRSARGAARSPLQPSLPPGGGFGSPSHVARCGQGGKRTAVPAETATPTAEFLPKKASFVRTGFVSPIPAIGGFCFVAECEF